MTWKRARWNRQERPKRAELREGPIGDAGRRDRPGRKLVVGVVLEEDVFVSVVLLRREPDLRPLEPRERNEVGLLALRRDRIALPDRLARHLPRARVEGLGMIGERVEIELGAKACEITSIGGRMHALASHQRQAPHERIHRQGRMNVEVAEEDAIGVGRRPLLTRRARGDVLGSKRNARDLAIDLLVSPPVDEPKSQDEQHQAKNDRETALFPPSHAGASIGPDNRLSKQSSRAGVPLRIGPWACYRDRRGERDNARQ